MASPAYHNATAASSTHYQSTSVVLSDANCPYYQFYRPPPSYETVISQSQGKMAGPLSPEQSQIVLQSPGASPCFAHSYNLAASRIGEAPGSIVPNGAVALPIAEISGHPHHSYAPAPDLCHSPHCPVNFRFYKRSSRKFATVNEEKASDTEEIIRSSPENQGEEENPVMGLSQLVLCVLAHPILKSKLVSSCTTSLIATISATNICYK